MAKNALLFSLLSIAPLLGMNEAQDAQRLLALEREVAQLHTSAINLQETIRHGINGFEKYDALGKLDFTLDEATLAATARAALESAQRVNGWAAIQKNDATAETVVRFAELNHKKIILEQIMQEMREMVQEASRTAQEERHAARNNKTTPVICNIQ
jgi:hypothetical protein